MGSYAEECVGYCRNFGSDPSTQPMAVTSGIIRHNASLPILPSASLFKQRNPFKHILDGYVGIASVSQSKRCIFYHSPISRYESNLLIALSWHLRHPSVLSLHHGASDAQKHPETRLHSLSAMMQAPLPGRARSGLSPSHTKPSRR